MNSTVATPSAAIARVVSPFAAIFGIGAAPGVLSVLMIVKVDVVVVTTVVVTSDVTVAVAAVEELVVEEVTFPIVVVVVLFAVVVVLVFVVFCEEETMLSVTSDLLSRSAPCCPA